MIQVAPYGPQWSPADSNDIPVSMDAQIQKAVDCYNAGATVLHVHVREEDGKGSKRLSKFNEMLARLRQAVPDMVLQVGGSISFAPEGDGASAKWLNDDTRHMLAKLAPAPDQVTIAINTSQMNVYELMSDEDIAGTTLAGPAGDQLAGDYQNRRANGPGQDKPVLVQPPPAGRHHQHVRSGQDRRDDQPARQHFHGARSLLEVCRRYSRKRRRPSSNCSRYGAFKIFGSGTSPCRT